MASNISKYKEDLKKLIKLGDEMCFDLLMRDMQAKGTLDDELKAKMKHLDRTFENNYQKWYTEAHAFIRQLVPDRLSEFEELYKGDGKRRQIGTTTYNIQDWLNGVRARDGAFEDFGIVTMRLQMQVKIVEAIEARFESSLFDIRQLVQADLMDSELSTARELAKHGFVRAAGAVAGVVVEKHLDQVATNHQVKIAKKHPAISDFNDALKNADVIDVVVWRGIQRLGDIRNICDHNKKREPKPEEVLELIDGAEKVTKTLF